MKWLLLLIIGITTAHAQESKALTPPMVVPPGADSFECGEYLVTGKLDIDSQKGGKFLKLYPTTTRSFPILLNGMSPKDAFLLEGAMIRVKLQVIQAGKGNLAKFNVIESPSRITKREALQEPVIKVTSKPCK